MFYLVVSEAYILVLSQVLHLDIMLYVFEGTQAIYM